MIENRFLNCKLYDEDTNATINFYNLNGLKLIDNECIKIEDFFVLGTGIKSELDLVNKYKFFQGYLDGPLKINNAYFIFGNEHNFNAWAFGSDKINIISINAQVFLNNFIFYETRKDEIINLLIKLDINLTYDNGLDTVTIMRQTIEMYLFYHEVAHLIQALPPCFNNERVQEIEINSFEGFDIMDHIAEIDADLFANIRIASHIIKIIKRGGEGIKNIENFIALIIAAYLLYRNLLLQTNIEFYVKKYTHPHLIIRMLAAIKDIITLLNQESLQNLNQNRIVDLSLEIMKGLCKIHPLISFDCNLSIYLPENNKLIYEYYDELISEIVKNKRTAYAKSESRRLGN